ncbi:MAG: cytochrome c3 family protein [Desulfosarcinaceae bacterium]|nr:cytochrome c3 family protein [Desulfosarcinaceae bacterium]
MRKPLPYLLLIVCIMAGTVTLGLAAQKMGAKEMNLPGGSRGDVPFPHFNHQTKLGDCNVCHGLFPQTKGSIEKLKADGKLKSKQVMNRHCIRCHKAEKKAGNASGPTTCAQCHVRS